MMAAAQHVVGGVDPHADTIYVAVVSVVGKIIGDAEFPTDSAGYAGAVGFLAAAGTVDRVGVEGAAGYGAGITRALRAGGVQVLELERPTRSGRRRAGKSDQLDAYHAARAVLADRSSPVKDPAVDGLRSLHLARRSAVKARTVAANQMKAILVMGPDALRAKFRGLGTDALVAAVLRCRSFHDDPAADTLAALKILAERHRSSAADYRRFEPRPATERRLFRGALRSGAGASVVGQDSPLAAVSRR